MALSDKLKKEIRNAIGDKIKADELITAIQASVASPAANVPLIGSTTNLVGVNGTGSNAAPLVGTESRLDAIEAKVDALLSALQAAGLMS